MENLNINDIEIVEVELSKNKKVRFAPTDSNLFVRYAAVKTYFENLEKEYQNATPTGEEDIFSQIEKMSKIDKEVKEKIDYIFNAEISKIAFGEVSAFSKCVNGKPLFENVIQILLNVVQEKNSGQIASFKNSDKAQKYLNKYKNNNPKYVKRNDFKKSN